MCGMVYRKIYITDFLDFYERYTWPVHTK
jgi:hypothetical protein